MSTQRPEDGDRNLDASGMRIAVVASRFNPELCEKLLEGALDCLRSRGAQEEDLLVVRVPGSFEIPLVADKLARAGRHDAVVCLGALVRGETLHYELIAAEAARGIAGASVRSGVPISFGVLTAESLEQAEARAGGALGNRGEDAALAAIEMVHVLRELEA
jgi:6,7-dimethyl-8-ribityllumazine synthase